MNQVPPQLRIWQLALGFATTEVLYALVKAGVIEQLREQPKRLSELAQACKLNADTLYRTLRFASVIGVVTQEGEQLIIDRVIASPADLVSAFYDLHMQVIQGGRARTEKEFGALLQKAGMKQNRIIPTKSPVKIIEASL
jgi:DNA-binding HxlR family transcriptional regulator